MKSSRFWISSARAASPEVMLNDQPGAIFVPPECSVATRMASVETATASHRRAAFLVNRLFAQ